MKIWILKTCWSHHGTIFGKVPCILILDNVSGHIVLFEGGWLPQIVSCIDLFANEWKNVTTTTSNHQPACWLQRWG